MTQSEEILQHLKSGNRISPLEALEKFGVFRLAARISDIRQEGYNVIAENITKNGKTFAQYRLESGVPRQLHANSFKVQPEMFTIPQIPQYDN